MKKNITLTVSLLLLMSAVVVLTGCLGTDNRDSTDSDKGAAVTEYEFHNMKMEVPSSWNEIELPSDEDEDCLLFSNLEYGESGEILYSMYVTVSADMSLEDQKTIEEENLRNSGYDYSKSSMTIGDKEAEIFVYEVEENDNKTYVDSVSFEYNGGIVNIFYAGNSENEVLFKDMLTGITFE